MVTAMVMATVMAMAMIKRKNKYSLLIRMFITKPYRFPHHYASVAIGICMFHAHAYAGDWTLTESTSIGVIASDRENDSGSNDSLFSVNVRPGFKLDGKGGRISANAQYALSAYKHLNGSGYHSLSHDLSATSTAEVYKDMVFLHATARAGLSSTNGESDSVTGLDRESDVRQTWAFTLKPEFRHHLGNYVDVVSNNVFDYVYHDDSQSNSSYSESFNLGITNGSRWNRIPWHFSVTQKKVSYQDRTDKSSAVSASASYKINRVWQTNGAIGYSQSDVQSSRSDTSSMTWDLGVDWIPNPRTSFSSSFGHRYYGYTWSGSLKHTSRRSSISITLNRELTNVRSNELRLRDVFYEIDGEPVLDPVTNEPLVIAQIQELNPIDEDFIRHSLNAAWVLKGRRNTLTISGNVFQRDYEVTANEETGYRLSAGISHQFAANLSGSLSTGFSSDHKSTASADSNTIDLGFSLSRRFSSKTSVSADYSFRQHDSDANNGYTENRLSLSLNTSFL